MELPPSFVIKYSSSPTRVPCLRAGRVDLQRAGIVVAQDQGSDADMGVLSQQGELDTRIKRTT